MAPLAIALLALATLPGCSYLGYELRRTDDTRQPTERSIFTDRDASDVYAAMVDDCLSKPWLDTWLDTTSERPKIAVGTVATDSRAVIDTLGITKQVEEELVNSGRVRVIADQQQVQLLVSERLAQREFTRNSDWAQMANQLGIDFLMIGRIGSQQYRTDDRQRVTYFQVNLELINIETAEKVWIQNEEVRKVTDDSGGSKPVKWWAWWRAF